MHQDQAAIQELLVHNCVNVLSCLKFEGFVNIACFKVLV